MTIQYKKITTIILLLISANILAKNPFQQPTNKLHITVIPLHYHNAADIAKLLSNKQNGFLAADSHIAVDKNNNSLWIQDSRDNLISLSDFIKQIDRPVKQILIEARIVNVDVNFSRDLGFEFSTPTASSIKSTGGFNMDIPAASTNHFNFTIAKLHDNTSLDMQLAALENEGHANIISRPKLTTINRKPAHIASGEDIPYQEKTGDGNTSIAFKKAALTLKVTPIIEPKNKILLDIVVNQDSVGSLLVNGVPSIQTREIQTKVLAENKQTIVLGGIYEEVQKTSLTSIPFLGSIPLLGALFREKKTEKTRNELLIFITPKIIY